MRWFALVFTALFSAFSFRLVYLQMIKHDEYAGLAAEKHVYKQADLRRARLDPGRERRRFSPKTCRSKRSWLMRRI